MKNAVLFSNYDYYAGDPEKKQYLDEKFPSDQFDFFFCENGEAPWEGYRFENAYIHIYAYQEPKYGECLSRIIHNRSVAKEPGEMHLFY